MEKNRLKHEFDKEIINIEKSPIFSPKYQKNKLLAYFVRTFFTITLFILFWKYTWIKWASIIYAPINIFSLFSIFGWTFLIKQKIRKTRKKIEKANPVV